MRCVGHHDLATGAGDPQGGADSTAILQNQLNCTSPITASRQSLTPPKTDEKSESHENVVNSAS